MPLSGLHSFLHLTTFHNHMKHTTFAAPHPPQPSINLRRPCSSNHLLFLHASSTVLSTLHEMLHCFLAPQPRLGAQPWDSSSAPAYCLPTCDRPPACPPACRLSESHISPLRRRPSRCAWEMYASLLTSPSVSVFLYFLCCTLGCLLFHVLSRSGVTCLVGIPRTCFASLAT